MKKSERLNDMMIYLKDKPSFNLKNIMEHYSISRSTALRDIQSLEEIGMPIYSKSGRNGFYGILPNRLLSPIVFSMDEVQALYFSMQTLNAYQSTPFHLSIEKLKQKFEACISAERITELRQMEAVFSLGSYRSGKECYSLKDIIQMAIKQQVCKVSYNKGGKVRDYEVQFFYITSAYGQWYATAYNFKTQKPQVFRCDKIEGITHSDQYCSKSLPDILALSTEIFRENDATDFEVGITDKGADIFYKEHYPSMKLHGQPGDFRIKGFYNRGEEDFIAKYILMYGEHITSIQPACLKTLVLEVLERIRTHLF